jgi:hypothetical protein
VYVLCRPLWFNRFDYKELAVLLVYGQVSELIVELLSILNEGWVFLPNYWWNPTLFRFSGYHITFFPQLVWLIAPIVFYFIAIGVKPNLSGPITYE